MIQASAPTWLSKADTRVRLFSCKIVKQKHGSDRNGADKPVRPFQLLQIANYIGENWPLEQTVPLGGVVLAPRFASARICESSEVMQNKRAPELL